MFKRYRKKPLEISAIKYTKKNRATIIKLLGEKCRHQFMDDDGCPQEAANLGIQTLEGEVLCRLGDYIIKGIKGEFYPCKPDIFEASYDPC